MNKYKAAAALSVALLAALMLPALNWAQDTWITVDDRISKEMEGKIREQAEAIRRAEQDAHIQAERAAMQAGRAEEIMIKAAKNANRDFKIFFDRGRGSVSPGNKIHEASTAVRNAKNDEDREKATRRLASALDEYFEEDMKARGKDLEDIRSRLAKLEGQLNRRREKKEEIIDLQMKVALNEADGLGFYSEKQDRMFNFPLPPPPTAFGPPADIVIGAPVQVDMGSPAPIPNHAAPSAPIKIEDTPAPVAPSPPAPAAAPVPAAEPR